MTERTRNFINRFMQHPLPVLFAALYMYIVFDAYQWMKTLEDPSQAEWIMNGLIAGAAAYFKFYTDLVMKTEKQDDG